MDRFLGKSSSWLAMISLLWTMSWSGVGCSNESAGDRQFSPAAANAREAAETQFRDVFQRAAAFEVNDCLASHRRVAYRDIDAERIAMASLGWPCHVPADEAPTELVEACRAYLVQGEAELLFTSVHYCNLIVSGGWNRTAGDLPRIFLPEHRQDVRALFASNVDSLIRRFLEARQSRRGE